MRKQRCSVCNGKIVNGVCSVCGMYDDNYEMKQTQQQGGKAPKPEKSQELGLGGSVILLILTIIIPLIIFVAILKDENRRNREEFEAVQGEEQIDEFAAMDISYDTTLTAGVYIVGIDIPEGIYSVKVLSGNGRILIWDDKHEVYKEYNLAPQAAIGTSGITENRMCSIKQLYLFENAEVYLYGAVNIYIASADADPEKLPALRDNPLTETYVLEYELFEGEYGYCCEYIAGKDFPAGTYDLVALKGFGKVEIGKDFFSRDYSMSAKENPLQEASSVKNVIIPDGFYLELDDYSTDTFTIELRPSERIISEDYEAFYEDYY